MTDQNQQGNQAQAQAPRKPFVEPAVSHPVDVLEATTFFQVVSSGDTGAKAKKDGK